MFVFFDGGLPHKKFLAFRECQSGVTGEAIADDILSKLAEWQLQPQLLCGQTYDVQVQCLESLKVLLLISFLSTLKPCTLIVPHTD